MARAPRSAPSVLQHVLPRGVPLPQREWEFRHRLLVAGALILAAVGLVWSVAGTSTEDGLLQGIPVVVLALLASRIDDTRRDLAACATTLAQMFGTAFIVHLSGGMIEAHFLFFVVVAGTTLYQSWSPFLTSVAFIVLHHGVMGGWRPDLIYNHQSAIDHPWWWALLHGALIGLAGLVGLLAWRSDERVRTEFAELAASSALVMEAAGDGIVALDAEARVVRGNPAAVLLLTGDRRQRLIGRPLGEVLRPLEGGAPLPQLAELADGTLGGSLRWLGAGTTGVPLELVLTRTQAASDIAAVVILRDLTATLRAEQAEARLATVAQQAAAQRRDVQHLRDVMRPDPLAIRGTDIGVSYLPAASSPAGGDHYDWVWLPDGELQLVVVDAMGRGISATKQALAVSSTVRTLALAGVPLEDLVARTDAVLGAIDPELIATVTIVRHDPRSGATRIASGGHPPVLHVGADGATFLEAEGVPIGYPSAGSDGLAETTLHADDLLLLYTDGLIEGTRDVQAGLTALADTARRLRSCPAQQLADRLLVEVPTAARQDDCLVLVLHRSAALADDDEVVVHRPDTAVTVALAPQPASVPTARAVARGFARDHGLGATRTDALVLLVSELATNAVLHAGTPFELSLRLREQSVDGSVHDRSPARPHVRETRTDDNSGRGLRILDGMAAAWGVSPDADGGGKAVWFSLPAGREDSGSDAEDDAEADALLAAAFDDTAWNLSDL